MTQFTYMAIKVADEDQFNQVAEKLRGMGYRADKDPFYSTWSKGKKFVIATSYFGFGLYSHSGTSNPTRYTYEQFMKL
jgi:hypothetical protein